MHVACGAVTKHAAAAIFPRSALGGPLNFALQPDEWFAAGAARGFPS